MLMGGNKEEDLAMRSLEGLRELKLLVDGIGPPLGEVVQGESRETRRITPLVGHAHVLGLEVHPYTARADDLPKWAETYADLMQVLTEVGVDGIFTDFPGFGR